MVAVGALNVRSHAAQPEAPGLSQAVTAYFEQTPRNWRSETQRSRALARVSAHPERYLGQMQRELGIRGERYVRGHAIGAQTTAALRNYNSSFGYAPGSNPISRFFASIFQQSPQPTYQHASYRGAPRNPAAGLAEPAVYRPTAVAPAPSSSGSMTLAEALREQTGGHYEPNHVYVVQVDQNNTRYNFGQMKGRTAIFTTDANGVPHQRGGTFTSSSQPSGDNPFFRQSKFADARHQYRYPYILEGAYAMNTMPTGPETGGIFVNARTAYRDANMNGQIDPGERQVVSTGGIMFHDDSAGSAGCQMIPRAEWPAFVQRLAAVSRELGVRGATYVLRRQSGQVWT